MFLCFQQELVHILEGFKHVSWKNDQETDDICNFTFSVSEFSRQNLCSRGIIDTETIDKLSTGKVVPEAAGDCDEGSSCSSSLSPVTSQVPEVGGDIKQCCGCLDTVFESTTLKASSTNETVAGSDSDSGVTRRNSDLCVVKSASEDRDVVRGQTTIAKNTEVSEAQGLKDRSAECCGILKAVISSADCAQNIAPNFVMPLEVDCDATVASDCAAEDTVLNDTFVLPVSLSSHNQNRDCRSFAERHSSQQKIQNKGNK